MKIGVALGSGSARGWAHIGVMRMLDELCIRPDIVCGTSIGAFVGAAYTAGDLDQLDSWARSLSWQKVVGFFDLGARGGLIKGEKLASFILSHFSDRDVADLPIKFGSVATDLATGREIWLRDGSIAESVRASMAVPGLFAPVQRGDLLLVDGGLVNPVPVSLCRALGADVVIAVDLGSDLIGRHIRNGGTPEPSADGWRQRLARLLGRPGAEHIAAQPEGPSLLDVVAGSINIMQVRIARSRLAGEPADVLIAPRLGHIGLLDYHRCDEAVEEGRETTRIMQPAILRALGMD